MMNLLLKMQWMLRVTLLLLGKKAVGIKAEQVIQIAREFAQNAAENEGRSMVIMGGGVNHSFNADMNYRNIINMLMLCGCVGMTGGGWARYVGQEKLRPQEGWANITFANDWEKGGAPSNARYYLVLLCN